MRQYPGLIKGDGIVVCLPECLEQARKAIKEISQNRTSCELYYMENAVIKREVYRKGRFRRAAKLYYDTWINDKQTVLDAITELKILNTRFIPWAFDVDDTIALPEFSHIP